jgi:hypothetical protein
VDLYTRGRTDVVFLPLVYLCVIVVAFFPQTIPTLLYIVMPLLWNIFRIHIMRVKTEEFLNKFLACERSMTTSN